MKKHLFLSLPTFALVLMLAQVSQAAKMFDKQDSGMTPLCRAAIEGAILKQTGGNCKIGSELTRQWTESYWYVVTYHTWLDCPADYYTRNLIKQANITVEFSTTGQQTCNVRPVSFF